MLNINLQLFGGRGSGGGNNPGSSSTAVETAVTNRLNKFVENTDISERSRLGSDELDEILSELPVGTRIYTGSKTLFGPGVVVDGKRVSEADTFFEVVESGKYPQFKRFGKDANYDNEYSSGILKELARGKRLKKLNIRIEKAR